MGATKWFRFGLQRLWLSLVSWAGARTAVVVVGRRLHSGRRGVVGMSSRSGLGEQGVAGWCNRDAVGDAVEASTRSAGGCIAGVVVDGGCIAAGVVVDGGGGTAAAAGVVVVDTAVAVAGLHSRCFLRQTKFGLDGTPFCD